MSQFTVDSSGNGPPPTVLETLTNDTGASTAAANNINLVSDSNFNTLDGVGVITGSGDTTVVDFTKVLSNPTPIGDETPNLSTFTRTDVEGILDDFYPLTSSYLSSAGNISNSTLRMYGATPDTIISGFGISADFCLQNTDGVFPVAGVLKFRWDSPISGVEDSRFVLGLKQDGNDISPFDIDSGSVNFHSNFTGADVEFFLLNGATTGASGACFRSQVPSSSTGDAYSGYGISSTSYWAVGIDNSDSDKLKITTRSSFPASPSIGTETLVIDASGRISYPTQPRFSAYLSSIAIDVTGDGTNVMLGTDTAALTELYDIGSNFNTNGTFTAPDTGVYLFNISVLLQNCTPVHNAVIELITTTQTYIFGDIGTLTTGNQPMAFSLYVPLTVGDTAVVIINSGNSTKTIDIFGNSTSIRTFFQGMKVA